MAENLNKKPAATRVISTVTFALIGLTVFGVTGLIVGDLIAKTLSNSSFDPVNVGLIFIPIATTLIGALIGIVAGAKLVTGYRNQPSSLRRLLIFILIIGLITILIIACMLYFSGRKVAPKRCYLHGTHFSACEPTY